MSSINLLPNVVYKLELPFRCFNGTACLRNISEIIPHDLQECNSGKAWPVRPAHKHAFLSNPEPLRSFHLYQFLFPGPE